MDDSSNTDNQGEDFASLFEASEQNKRSSDDAVIVAGRTVTGTVTSISAESVFVSLGGKSDGVLEAGQVTDEDGTITVAVGDSITAHVVDAGERTGMVELRCKVGRGSDARGELQLAFENEIPVEGVVAAVNDGGFDVQIAGVRGFCPVSQMDIRFVEQPETFVGRRADFRIMRFEDHGRGDPNIVLSRRILLEEAAEIQARETRAKLEVDAVFPGIVRTIRDYGAFVDIGGIEGMLHISELGYFRVEHPSEVLEVDQQVQVQVIRIERGDDPRRPEKIALSLKALATDPWASASADFPVGRSMQGRVTRIETYGAFVELVAGIEGLVHVSEMGDGTRVGSPRKLVTEGQEVMVSVLECKAGERRISLSMDAAGRAVRAAEERSAIEEHSPAKQKLGSLGDLLEQSFAKKR